MREPETIALTLPAELLAKIDREVRFAKRRAGGRVTRESFIRELIREGIDDRRTERRAAREGQGAVQPVSRPNDRPPKRRLYPVTCNDPMADLDLSRMD